MFIVKKKISNINGTAAVFLPKNIREWGQIDFSTEVEIIPKEVDGIRKIEIWNPKQKKAKK